MNANRVPAVGPDGSPITVPRERVGELEAAHGHVQTSEEADAQDAAAQAAAAPVTPSALADAYVDTTAASMHGLYRGLGESFGVPVDAGAVGVASLFGRESGKRTRNYLQGLDERHPYVTGGMGLAGNVAGAVAGQELLGGGPKGGALAARAGRVTIGGVENVVQATTKDVNESALGDVPVNAQKLVAAMPKHFMVGALLSGAFEGGAAGLEAGSAALSRKAVPALERRATGALGHELGLEGEEALAAGQRVRDLHGGEIPRDRGELEGILTKEQGAQREGIAATANAERDAAHAAATQESSSLADALHGSQQAEIEGLGVYHEGVRKGAREAGERGVADAEAHAVDDGWEGLAARESHVAEAEAKGAERTGAAHAEANEADLASIRADRAADPEAIYSEVAAAGRSIHEVQGHYETVLSEIEQQRIDARRAVATFEKEHAEITAELAAVTKRVGPAPHTAEEIAATGKSNYVKGPIYRVGSVGSPTGNRVQGPYQAGTLRGRLGLPYREADAQAAEALAAAEATGHAPYVAEAERLGALQKSYAEAHQVAADHLAEIEKHIGRTEKQAAKDIQAVSQQADRAVGELPAQRSEAASKAKLASDAALDNVRRVEEETKAFVDAARAKGSKAQAQAEARGRARIESAKADAEKATEEVNRVTVKERQALEEHHAKQREGLPKVPEKGADVDPATVKTDVDPLLKGMKNSAERPRGHLFSPHSGMSAVFSLVHGHPLGAAATLVASFAAGQARNVRNLAAARTLRMLSGKIGSVDTAIQRGAARLLGHAGAAAAMGIERDVVDEHVSRREPKFDDLAKNLVDLQANPLELEHRVRSRLGHLVEDAPEHYQALLAQTTKAQVYLYSILPVPSKDPNSLTPHLEKGHVSDSEQRDFMQAVSAVDDPLSVFANTKEGTITQMQVDAIRNVHEDLYDQMRNEIRFQTLSLRKPIDYEDEVNIGMLMGVLTNQVLEPDFQALQSKAYKSKAAAGAPVGGQAQGGGGSGGDMKLAKSLTSGSQAVEGGTP